MSARTSKKKTVKKKASSGGSGRSGSRKVPKKAAKRKTTKKTTKKKLTGKKLVKKKVAKKVVKKTTRKTAKKTGKKTAKKTAQKAGKKKVSKKGKKKVSAAKRKKRRRAFASFRKKLLEKQLDLIRKYTAFKGDHTKMASDGTEDYIDYAVSSYAREFMLSLSELDRKQLRLVDDALGRIDLGEYGDCQHCGTDIPDPRLEVQPWARYCIKCQELEDKGLLAPEFSRDFSSAKDELDEGEDENLLEDEEEDEESESSDEVDLEPDDTGDLDD